MSVALDHISGVTTHTRRGNVRHSFRYGVDFVFFDTEASISSPLLFSYNRFNLASVHEIDHGGPLKAGRGAGWARQVLAQNGLDDPRLTLMLLTQPRFLGYDFNPVSFWFAMNDEVLIAAIAEVSTPFGDRHSYLCHLPAFTPITGDARISKPKALHVSPFQEVAGEYEFGFDVRADQIAIRILYRNGDEGVVATLSGPRKPLTNASLVWASLRRPLGALRTIGLIHWQAVRLKLKGARYLRRPAPPTKEIT